MKKILTTSLAFVLVLGMVSCGNSQTQSKTEVSVTSKQSETIAKDIDTDQFQELMDSRKNSIVLDVRTPQEVASGVIGGSVAIDYNGRNFTEEISKLDKNAPILLYCASGNRSGRAMSKMGKMGFTELYSLSGGIGAWSRAGKSIK